MCEHRAYTAIRRRIQLRRDLPIVAALAVCMLPCTARNSCGQTAPPGADPSLNRRVTAIPLQSPNPDVEASWIIQPEIQRIPNIAGFNRNLPPHIEQRLAYAYDLAQRGATYSADTEFRAVLGLCALELDAREGGTSHRDALRQGWVAVDEADQFSGDQIDWHDASDVRRVAVGHSTPILKNSQVPVDSIQAAQAYYAFAEDRLVYATQGVAGSTLAYYGLARTLSVPGSTVSHAAGKAALFHRVALVIAPQNTLAANELGVLLVQHGQLNDAQALFQQCVAIDPTPQTWRNLAAVYARQGHAGASQAAYASANVLEVQKQQQLAAAAANAAPGAPAATANAAASPEAPSGFMAKLNLIPKLSNPFRR